MAARHRVGTAPPIAKRALVVLLALAAILLCGNGISSAEPATPTPAPPTLTTPTPPATVTPPTTGGIPAPVTQQQRPYSPSPSGGGADESDCGVSDISACVAGAIDGFFRRLVESAFNPVLELLSKHLLTTPEPDQLPRVGELWDSSWQLVLAMYGLIVIAAGVLLMLHETLQTRWGWRELGPRLVVGFIAGAMSMILATKAIQFANGLTVAVAGDGLEPDSTAAAFRSMMDVGDGAATGLFVTLMLVALIVVLTILLITWVIRLVITVVLVASAPLAMMCYALPGLDAVARWWWRAFGACLAIQVVQSLVLIVGLRVFLSPNWSWFGPTPNGMISIIVATAMALLLVKIPFWLLSVLKIGNGRGMVSSAVRGFVMYKTLGLLKGTGRSAAAASRMGKPKPTGRPIPTPDPYAKVRATRSGQLMLPLHGVRRVPPPPAPQPRIPAAASIPVAAPQGQQLMLPLPQFHGGVNLGPTPVLGRNGQYQLPIPVQRVPKPVAPPTPPVARPLPGTRSPQPKQLAFDYSAAAPSPPDPYAKVRPTRSGQYPLPIEVRRTSPPRTPTPPPPRTATPPTPPPRVSSSAGRQLHLPLPDLPVRRRGPRRTPGKGSK
ncbi:hypothetical protein HLB23_38460 [Nocardia uniformis]|uniref:Uncharacterized protein n=1 Tax=Nocardia uniformis TaxID=53432 RepID=A0A849CFP3_9NOCA|nr:hypothetical protein [Nocardia uniformis]NNH75670.1 hypothetical protein [Nocardia uniformis]